jgi:DNA invertase Pin-like site-specific DNA recombinase
MLTMLGTIATFERDLMLERRRGDREGCGRRQIQGQGAYGYAPGG